MYRILIGLFALMVAAVPMSAHAETRNFGEWQVTCDEFDFCAATSATTASPHPNQPADYTLQVARQPYETYWEITFISDAALPSDTAFADVSVDNNTTTFNSPEEFAAYDALNSYYLTGDKAQLVMDQMTPGTVFAVRFTNMQGDTHVASFFLSGLTAALLWIDEKQQRLGAERVAKAPPTNKTRVTTREPDPMSEQLLAHHATDPNCSSIEDLANGADRWSYRISATQSLHILPCWSGAYNFSWVVYVQGQYDTLQHYFAHPTEAGSWTASAELTNVNYDERALTLSTYAKGRGLGDCGTSGLWQWNGSTFELLEFSAKYQCDGQGNPGEFPVIYRAHGYIPPREN